MTPAEQAASALNQQCIEGLRAANLSSRVAVIGSGPSRPYITPVERLVELLCKACGISPQVNELLCNLCQRAFDANPDAYHGVMRQAYGETPHWTSNTYRHLVAGPFQGFATLNHDPQLPYEFFLRYRDQTKFSVYPCLNGAGLIMPQELFTPPPSLVALHGYAAPDDPEWERHIILKRDDYNAHYADGARPLFGWWLDLLLAVPCIFIGTSLLEPGLRLVMEHLATYHRDRIIKMKHIHLLNVTQDPKTLEYPNPAQTFEVIDQVLFDLLPDSTGLMRVLAPFSGMPVDRPVPRAPAPRRIRATDSFDPTKL